MKKQDQKKSPDNWIFLIIEVRLYITFFNKNERVKWFAFTQGSHRFLCYYGKDVFPEKITHHCLPRQGIWCKKNNVCRGIEKIVRGVVGSCSCAIFCNFWEIRIGCSKLDWQIECLHELSLVLVLRTIFCGTLWPYFKRQASSLPFPDLVAWLTRGMRALAVECGAILGRTEYL